MSKPSDCIILVPSRSPKDIDPATRNKIIALKERGYGFLACNGGSIDMARSELASRALAMGYRELFWLDDDIDFDLDDVEKLRSHNLPITCGLYRYKTKQDFACQWMPGTSELVCGVQGGLMEIRLCGMGFVHTRAEVFESIRVQLNMPACTLLYADDKGDIRKESILVPYFIPQVVKGDDGAWWYQNEDYAWCWRARACGFKVMADTTIKLLHHGSHWWSWDDMLPPGTPPGMTVKFKVEHKEV